MQTTGGRDELNILCMQKSQRTSQNGTQNVKTHTRTTQEKPNKMSNTDLTKNPRGNSSRKVRSSIKDINTYATQPFNGLKIYIN